MLRTHTPRFPTFALAQCVFPLGLGLGLTLASCAICSAQNTSAPTASASSYADSATASDIADNTAARSRQRDELTSLSAAQIIEILQRQPDVVVELKSLLVDQMQQQGVSVDQDSITDEMLYTQINSSAATRSSITVFLRARGYVSDDDLQQAKQSSASSADDLSLQSLAAIRGGNLSAGSLGSLQTRSLPDSVTGMQSSRAGLRPYDDTIDIANSARSSAEGQRNAAVHASTDEPQVLRKPGPYNLRSMRDLYTQLPESNGILKRFGSEMFLQRASISAGISGSFPAPLDVPPGPDYVIGPGDTLSIDLWGAVTQNISREVNRDGHILLPEAGSLDVAGLSLAQAQAVIAKALQQQFRNARVAVTVSKLHSVHIYIVGDVQRPGGYDVSSLASPLGALYAAGGPTAAGSLRLLRHMRGSQTIETVDLYDFLLGGRHSGSARFESGDTLLVPPTGAQVAISGAVKRPAIYELKSDATLDEVVEYAGGFTASAALDSITVERIDTHQRRETVAINLPQNAGDAAAAAVFKQWVLSDGDRIRVGSIMPYSQRAVYLEGHVVRPGHQAYRDGMQLSDVLHSYRDLLPEPAAHGEIVRLIAPDLHAETIEFSVPEVLVGNQNFVLQPFDTIRVFGRYEQDAPRVTIRGEVQRPGLFPLSSGMTAAQLVRLAGGFKRDALLTTADLASYTVVNGTKVVDELSVVDIGAAVGGKDPTADVVLKAEDVLTIRQITGWNDIGQSVRIDGEVAHPGSYGFADGERLSSVLRRAGGFRSTAYPAGAVLTREQVRELEEKSRAELIRQIETSSAAAKLQPSLAASDASVNLQLVEAQQNQVLNRLKSTPPTGRLVVHLSPDIDSWANTDADIEVRRGDVITIPKRPGFVLVTGQVYNATAITFIPDKSADWYLRAAGGTSNTANRKEIFIVRANGSVIGRRSGGWGDNVLSTKLNPGDVIVVPQKILGNSLFWRNLLTAAQLASSIAITAAVASL